MEPNCSFQKLNSKFWIKNLYRMTQNVLNWILDNHMGSSVSHMLSMMRTTPLLMLKSFVLNIEDHFCTFLIFIQPKRVPYSFMSNMNKRKLIHELGDSQPADRPSCCSVRISEQKCFIGPVPRMVCCKNKMGWRKILPSQPF